MCVLYIYISIYMYRCTIYIYTHIHIIMFIVLEAPVRVLALQVVAPLEHGGPEGCV